MFLVFSKSLILQKQCRLSQKIIKELDVMKFVSFHKTFSTSYKNEVQEDHKYTPVYYGSLTPQIRAVKVFSLCSSIAGLIAQPILIKEASTVGSTTLLVALCSVVGFFTFITPILLHIITKKYVTEIHYNPDKTLYKATTYNFFLRPKQVLYYKSNLLISSIEEMTIRMDQICLLYIFLPVLFKFYSGQMSSWVSYMLEFSPNDVVVPDIPGMFTTMSAKGKSLFIEARHFNDPLHYAKIMGYDKPMDFKLGETDDSDTKQDVK